MKNGWWMMNGLIGGWVDGWMNEWKQGMLFMRYTGVIADGLLWHTSCSQNCCRSLYPYFTCCSRLWHRLSPRSSEWWPHDDGRWWWWRHRWIIRPKGQRVIERAVAKRSNARPMYCVTAIVIVSHLRRLHLLWGSIYNTLAKSWKVIASCGWAAIVYWWV